MADDVERAVNCTSRNVLVLGAAGTGKTHSCLEAISKGKLSVMCCATTGVAAIKVSLS